MTVLSLSLNVLDRLISKCGPMNNLSNIILVLRHGDSLCRTGRLCTFFRKWIASEAAEMRQRVRCDASHKVSYFPGRLHVGDCKEQRQPKWAEGGRDSQLALLSVGQIAISLVGQLALAVRNAVLRPRLNHMY